MVSDRGADRLSRLAALLLAVLPAAASSQQHPHLLYGPEDVARLRAEASSTHAYIAEGLRLGTDDFVGSGVSSAGIVSWPSGRTFDLGDVRDIGNGIAVFAFVWQLQGGDGYLKLARDWLLAATSWPSLDLAGDRDLVLAHMVTGVAIAYDILHDQLSEAERTQVVSALSDGAGLLNAYGTGGGWWEGEYLQNHNWINHAAVGLAGLALAGEIPDATTAAWVDYARKNAETVNRVTDPITDGTWHEGPGYLGYGYMFQLPFAWALARAGGADLTDMAILRGDASLRAHAQVPEKPWQKVLTYADFYEFGIGEGLMQLRFAASRYRDPVAQAVADRQVAGSPRYTYAVECLEQVFEYLFYDPSVPAADLAQLPLDWYGEDLQAVVFRSGWGKGSTLFAMKSGPMGGRSVWDRVAAGDPYVQALNIGHDHADDNGFYLNTGGSWLAPEALGYYIGHPESPGPQANRTAFHNALTIDGLGQAGEGVRATDNGPSLSWYAARAGSIPFHASSAGHAYAVADGAGLYPAALGLRRWDRHALFLGRRWVVLRDVVRADAAHDFHWFVHLMNGAVREGSWIRGSADGGRSLGVAVISPPDWILTVTQQAPLRVQALNPAGSVYAAEVAPAAAAAAVTFLTALVPTSTDAWASRPAIDPLDPAVPDAGLAVTDGARVASAIFSDDPSGTASAGGLALSGLAGVAEVEAGTPRRALLVQARSLERGGVLLASQDGTAAMLEADGLADAELRLSGDSLGAATIRAPAATRVTWYGQDVPFVRSGDYVRVDAKGLAAPSGGGSPGGGGSGSGSGGALEPRPPGSGCSAGVTAEALALLGAIALLRGRRAGQSGSGRAPRDE